MENEWKREREREKIRHSRPFGDKCACEYRRGAIDGHRNAERKKYKEIIRGYIERIVRGR